MSLRALSDQEVLNNGDRVQITVGSTCAAVLRPSPSTIIDTLRGNVSYTPTAVNIPLFGCNGILISGIVDDGPLSVSELKSETLNELSSVFLLFSVSIDVVEKEVTTFGDAFKLPTSTSVALAAVAVIALVIFFMVR